MFVGWNFRPYRAYMANIVTALLNTWSVQMWEHKPRCTLPPLLKCSIDPHPTHLLLRPLIYYQITKETTAELYSTIICCRFFLFISYLCGIKANWVHWIYTVCVLKGLSVPVRAKRKLLEFLVLGGSNWVSFLLIRILIESWYTQHSGGGGGCIDKSLLLIRCSFKKYIGNILSTT